MKTDFVLMKQNEVRVLVSAGSNSSIVHSKNAPPACGGQCISGAPAGIRTPDTLLKRSTVKSEKALILLAFLAFSGF